MSAKKLVGFLVPLKAISPRNLTSLGLVAVFFAVYVICGGKIQSVPKVPVGKSFGGVQSSSSNLQNLPTRQNQNSKASPINRRHTPPAGKKKPTERKPQEKESGSLKTFRERINNIGRGDN